MRKSAIWILLTVAVASMWGCAGSQNSPYQGTTPFTGSWSGTWDTSTHADHGTMTLSVSDTAVLIGTFHDVVTGETGIVHGTTSPGGGFNSTFTVDGTNVVISVNGVMSLASTTSPLTGNAQYVRPGAAPLAMNFSLNPQGSTSPYAGSFPATISAGVSGTMTLTISASGTIIGTYDLTSPATMGSVTGSVDMDGNFTLHFVDSTTSATSTATGIMTIDTTDFKQTVWGGNGTYTSGEGSPAPFYFQSPADPN